MQRTGRHLSQDDRDKYRALLAKATQAEDIVEIRRLLTIPEVATSYRYENVLVPSIYRAASPEFALRMANEPLLLPESASRLDNLLWNMGRGILPELDQIEIFRRSFLAFVKKNDVRSAHAAYELDRVFTTIYKSRVDRWFGQSYLSLLPFLAEHGFDFTELEGRQWDELFMDPVSEWIYLRIPRHEKVWMGRSDIVTIAKYESSKRDVGLALGDALGRSLGQHMISFL